MVGQLQGEVLGRVEGVEPHLEIRWGRYQAPDELGVVCILLATDTGRPVPRPRRRASARRHIVFPNRVGIVPVDCVRIVVSVPADTKPGRGRQAYIGARRRTSRRWSDDRNPCPAL